MMVSHRSFLDAIAFQMQSIGSDLLLVASNRHIFLADPDAIGSNPII